MLCFQGTISLNDGFGMNSNGFLEVKNVLSSKLNVYNKMY